jgi:cyclopropane fatty-acyl-phospholipid synthase-like methyltransferase
MAVSAQISLDRDVDPELAARIFSVLEKEYQVAVPRFSFAESVQRVLFKALPFKFKVMSMLQRWGYRRRVQFYYTLLSPLFQIIWGTHNTHSGYFATGNESWPLAQHLLTYETGRALGLRPSDHVADIGCGVGGPAVTTAVNFGCKVTGVNITRAHLRRAAANVRCLGLEQQVNFRYGDAFALPFPDAHFDHVYSIESVSHWSGDKTPAIQQLARVLKPGGRVVIVDAYVEKEQELLNHPDFNFFTATWGVGPHEWIRPGHVPRAFAAAGLRLIEERDWYDKVRPTAKKHIEYTVSRRNLVVDLYGQQGYDLTLKSLGAFRDIVERNLLGYAVWVGEKS